MVNEPLKFYCIIRILRVWVQLQDFNHFCKGEILGFPVCFTGRRSPFEKWSNLKGKAGTLRAVGRASDSRARSPEFDTRSGNILSFLLPLIQEGQYVHEVLVNRLGGLSLPRKSVVRLTDRPDMTIDVYRGRKTTKQQQLQQLKGKNFLLWEYINYFNPFLTSGPVHF